MNDRPLTGARRQLALYFSAQEFLTRLPVPAWIGYEPDRLARASRYFPIVGLLVGTVAGLVWVVFSALTPPILAAGLAIATMIVLTGALHEDGLADCCDGLGGAFTRDRALEIMRDSRIGVYAAIGLILFIGLRWQALGSADTTSGFLMLLIGATAGRAAITMVLATGTYARTDGAATGVAGGARPGEVAIAVAIALITGLAAGAAGLLAVILTLIGARFWLVYLHRRLGGYTGDGLGATEQIGQIIACLILTGAAT